MSDVHKIVAAIISLGGASPTATPRERVAEYRKILAALDDTETISPHDRESQRLDAEYDKLRQTLT